MTQTKMTRAFVSALVLLGGGVFAFANMEPNDSRVLQYSGMLRSDGEAVTGAYDFRVGLFVTDTDANARGCLLNDPPDCALWSSEISAVDVVTGAFGLTLGEYTALSDSVLAQSALYLALAVREPNEAGFSLLDGYQRIVPTPFASRAAAAKSFKVTSDLSVGGTLAVTGSADLGATVVDSLASATSVSATTTVSAARVAAGRYVPSYADWSADTGAGGSAIVNDNNVYKKLMVIGNNSAGGARQVGIWDHLTVHGNMTASGQLAGGSLRQRACQWRNASPYSLGNNQNHTVTCAAGEYMAGWSCYASDRIDGNCQAYCCLP